MLFDWNENTIRWYCEASDYTGYTRNLADLLRDSIAPGSTLCDMGCGLALLDFELASYLQQITCVDINPNALAFVQQHAAELNITNLTTMQCPGPEAEGKWDTVLAMFHGAIEKVGRVYLSKANRNLIMVTHGDLIGSTGPEQYRERKCVNKYTTRQWLEEQGLEYTAKDCSLEFGQPHRSMEEAIACTAAYCPSAPMEELRAYVRNKVVETGNPEFPYYTPKVRRFTIYNILKPEKGWG